MDTKEKLKKLDSLREEKDRYQSFYKGGGNFFIQNNITLLKDFGIGKWELRIYESESTVKDKIMQILNDRVKEIDLEIEGLLHKENNNEII